MKKLIKAWLRRSFEREMKEMEERMHRENLLVFARVLNGEDINIDGAYKFLAVSWVELGGVFHREELRNKSLIKGSNERGPFYKVSSLSNEFLLELGSLYLRDEVLRRTLKHA